MLKKFKNRVTTAVVLASSALATGAVFAQTPDASAQVTSLITSQAAYATSMFGLALAAVGIMIGVKWIKRARGAA